MTIEGVDITPGSGKTVAVDTINVGGGNKEFQILKLALGAEDALDLVLDSGQQVMANSIPVVLASDAPPLLKRLSVTPTVSITIYDAGDCMGGKITLTNAMRISGGEGYLESIHLIEKSQQKPTLQFHIFESDPTAATLTDHSAITFSTDLAKVIQSFVVPSSVWFNDSGYAFASVELHLPVKANGTANLYLAMSTPGTPDFAATDALILDFMILQR